jgi:hypothetical protein
MAPRRILPSLLLCLMLFQAGGPLVVFTLQRTAMRLEMRARILRDAPDETLVCVPVPAALERNPGERFRRMEDDEFRLDGRMYDVARSSTRGDTTWYWCIPDDGETALFAGLDRMIRDDLNNNPSRRQQTAQLTRLFSLPFTATAVHRCPPPTAADAPAPFYAFSLQTWLDAPPAPPPKS